MYGTAWMAPPPYRQQQYNPNQPYNGAQAPPIYSPPGVVPQQTGSTFNTNDGYYGHHQYQGRDNGIELQQPASAYQRGGENVYQAPTGPPPGKKAQGDGIIQQTFGRDATQDKVAAWNSTQDAGNTGDDVDELLTDGFG